MSIANIVLPQDKKEEDILGGPLTKSTHRNPELHLRGDSLPESLLEYQEGSGTLNPDVAGNTPQMERLRQVLNGNSISQALTVTDTQLGNMAVSVTCPIQAVGSPIVRLTYKVQLNAAYAGGPNGNFAAISVYSNGVILANLDASSIFQAAGTVTGGGFIWHVTETSEIPISPGQTLNLDVRGLVATVTTPQWTYSVNTSSNRCGMRAVLLY